MPSTVSTQGWTPASPLPDAVAPLVEVAYNLHWTYCPAAWAAFARVDGKAWEATGHNPVRTLAGLSPERLAELAKDAEFFGLVKQAAEWHKRSLEEARKGWYSQAGKNLPTNLRPFQVAYFCAEYGITEGFQIYSGGLGLLAGDHLKSAADLGLPFIAVGLLYRNGYFHQALDEHGLQQELYPAMDAPTQPVKRLMGGDGLQIKVYIDLPGYSGGMRTVACAVWRAEVGGVRLYLLDTNIPENAPEVREITANLYLGDQRRRIEQEIVLGIGGVRALIAAGEEPTVFHMNEGHAAFMALERIRLIRAACPNLSFDQAREAAAPSHVFTTHTPVPAGIDHFNSSLVKQYFSNYHASIGLDLEGFMALGRENVADRNESFSMAVLALRTSKWCNGVSKLHGQVSRVMWKNIWPGVPEGDIPIGHVTNGVHAAGWISPGMAALYDKHLGTDWRGKPDAPESWAATPKIPDRELWQARGAARGEFIKYCERRAAAGMTGGCACSLNPDLLTIGFARRFAGYKRATLLFRDPNRLMKLLVGSGNNPGFQLVVAGKSHPGDGWGKHLIRDIVDQARDPKFKGRVLFLEDYGIDVAREMVRGSDVWLNTPIRGLEASGTSGMKAALNGVLNASILDGWWDEGFAPDLGFKIEDKGIYPNDAPDEEREDFESNALYDLLEKTLLPEFYGGRGGDGVPVKWTARMKRCIQELGPAFNTHRMVKEYATKYYFPAHTFASRLAVIENGDIRQAREVSDHIDRYRGAWAGVRVKSVQCAPDPRGDGINVAAAVRLAGLRPDEVSVEAYYGAVDEHGAIPHGQAVRLESKSALGDTTYQYAGIFHAPAENHTATPRKLGSLVRVIPGDARLASPFIPGLIVSSNITPIEADHGLNV